MEIQSICPIFSETLNLIWHSHHSCSSPSMVSRRMTLSPREGYHNSTHHLLSWTSGAEELPVRSSALEFCLPKRDGSRTVILWQFTISFDFASTTQPVHTRQQCSYMGAWASQATVPFIQHICRYVQISSNIYKRKNRSTKAGHENPKKPAGGKNTGNVYPRPRQWCNPWGFRVC